MKFLKGLGEMAEWVNYLALWGPGFWGQTHLYVIPGLPHYERRQRQGESLEVSVTPTLLVSETMVTRRPCVKVEGQERYRKLYDLTHVLCIQTHEHATHTMHTVMRNRYVTHSAQGVFMILGAISFIWNGLRGWTWGFLSQNWTDADSVKGLWEALVWEIDDLGYFIGVFPFISPRGRHYDTWKQSITTCPIVAIGK